MAAATGCVMPSFPVIFLKRFARNIINLLFLYTRTSKTTLLLAVVLTSILYCLHRILKGGKNNTRNPAQSSRFSIAVIRVFLQVLQRNQPIWQKKIASRDVLLSLHVHITHFKQLALQILHCCAYLVLLCWTKYIACDTVQNFTSIFV